MGGEECVNIRFVYLLLLLASFMPFMGWASPTLDGRVGGFRVQSAESIPQGYTSLSYSGEYFYQDNFFFGSRNYKISDDVYFNIAPFKNTLLFFGKQSNAIYHESGYDSGLFSNGFAEIGLSLQGWVSDKIGLGLETNSGVYYGSNISSWHTVSPSFKAVFSSILFKEDDKALNFHYNLQYKYNQSAQATNYIDTSTYNQAYFIYPRRSFHFLKNSFGLEYATSYVDFILEYSSIYLLDSDVSFLKHPNYITTGLKIRPFKDSGISFNIGSDFGLNRGDYLIFGIQPAFDYNVFVGISLERIPTHIASAFRGIPTLEEPLPQETTIEENAIIVPVKKDNEEKNLLLKFRKPDVDKKLLLKFRDR